MVRLPTPIFTVDHLEAYSQALKLAARAGIDFMRQFVAQCWDLTVLPRSISSAVGLALATVSTGQIYVEVLLPDSPLPQELVQTDILREVEIRLRQCGGSIAEMLSRIKQNLLEYRSRVSDVLCQQQLAHVQCDDTVLEFDFSTEGSYDAPPQSSFWTTDWDRMLFGGIEFD
jgi:hypothetical protein